MLLEITIVLVLILANGVFALAEIAIVSARRARLRKLALDGNVRAKAALALADSPGRFLSATQLGITLIGVFAGAFGGATVARSLAVILERVPLLHEHAMPVSVGIVVLAITVLSLIFGELVPKRIALSQPERAAMAVARPMQALARVGGPIVTVLAAASDLVLRWLGVARTSESTISDEEITLLIEQGLHEGVFHESEKHMVESVLALDRLPVTAIMNPRPRIVWLELDDPDDVNWRKIVASGHSHFPVIRGSTDNIVGMLSVKSLWANSAAGFVTPMRDLLTKPLFVPETASAVQLLETFKRTGRHIALVMDEFGTVSGIVTLIDVLEAIVGDLPMRGHAPGPDVRQRDDGSWLMDATLPIADLKEVLKIAELPGEETADFQTLAGFVVTQFGRIPRAGDWFEAGGFRWEVVDMDRYRVDKVLIAPLASSSAELPENDPGS